MGWKYVMFELQHDGLTIQFPVIFPDKMVHLEVATVMKFVGPLDEKAQVVSAGSIETLVVRGVGGRSDTLRLGSSSGDERTINLYNYAHGLKED